MQQTSSSVSQRQTNQLAAEYGTLERFLQTFNPDVQSVMSGNLGQCFYGDFPTLASVKAAFGSNAPAMWLVPQLYNLSEFCGCREKLQGAPLEECARVIATEFYYLKVSELMLFFHRFKTGRYGRFYGSVDPLVITTSLREFIRERNNELFIHEQKIREQKEMEERKNAISYEEYIRRSRHGEVSGKADDTVG